MNYQDSNTLTAVKYFKNNYIKMIIFILISLILTGLLTHKYYKDNELYFSTVKIRVNGSIKWNIKDLINPHYDILYFLENRNVENIKLIQNRHKNNILQIEIPHKFVDEKNNKDLQNLIKIMKNYEETLADRSNKYADYLEKGLRDRISETTNENVIKSYHSEIENLLARKNIFLELINEEVLFKIVYDGKINIKKAKRQMAKNLVMSLMISIILIIFSLWIKLFIREIKKNS